MSEAGDAPRGRRTSEAGEAPRGRRIVRTGPGTRGAQRNPEPPRGRRPVRNLKDGRAAQDVETVSATVEEDFVAGRHPVLEALKAGRPINKLLVADTAAGGSLTEILGKAKAQGLIVHRVPKASLARIAGDHHQGVVAYVAPHRYAEPDEILARDTGQLPLIVALDEVTDPHNFGAILRTCEATGVQGVLIPKRRSVPLTGVVAKAAAGALEYVPVARVGNMAQALDELKRAGYWIVGTDAEATTSFTEIDYRAKTVIVIGAEGSGLGRLIKEKCDHLVKLPMLGELQSLNASVAAGVLLYEVVKQRARPAIS